MPRTIRGHRSVWSRFMPLARRDLRPGDFVRVQCIARGHDELLTPKQLRIKGLALPPHTRLLELSRVDRKGKAVVSVRWGGGS
jgi:hypothetical protein